MDELARVTADFDASAAQLGLTCAEALEQMRGTEFVEARRVDMQRTFARHARLSADLDALRGAGPFSRAYLAGHLADKDMTARTRNDFRPALPLTFEGGVFAGVGAVAGWAAMAMALALLRGLFAPLRRRRSDADVMEAG